MNIPNLILAHNHIIEPMLGEMLQKLSLDKPNWQFREPTPEFRCSLSQRAKNGQIAPEGKWFVYTVVVVEDGREAGTISISTRYSRIHSNKPSYEIRSPRISNGRRGEYMETTKMDVAVRNAKKYFEAPKTGEMLYDAEEEARSDLARAIYDLQVPVVNGRVLRGNYAPLLQFAYLTLTGKPIPPTVQLDMKTMFLNKEFEEHLANCELGEQMKHKTYTALYELDGGFYCWEDEATKPKDKTNARHGHVVHLSFEQLPEWMQNKVAVLRVLEDKELVLDIGFKPGDNMFLVAHD